MVNKWSFLAQFKPQGICLLCGAQGQPGLDLCPACQTDLPWLGPACPRCALPLPPHHSGLCGQCLQAPPPQDASIAALLYDTPLPFLISGLKFHSRLAHARLLGQLLAGRLLHQPRTDLPQVLLPVPLHKSRLRERGFNQALEIARVVARELHLDIDTTTCIRRHPTSAQSELDATARRRNLRKAFALNQTTGYQHVAIVDDVLTTGVTVAELARTLKCAGVKRVEVWSVVRTAKN